MKRRWGALALVLLCARAEASPCGDPRDAAGGPLAGGTDGADYGAIPEACAGTDLALRLRGTLLVARDAPDFYGNASGTATLRLRHRLFRSDWIWLSVAVDVTTFRYVANAVVTSHDFSFGPATLGIHRALGAWERAAATIYARGLLPLDTARSEGARMGLEVGATARQILGARGRFGVEGGAALLAPVVIVAGQTHWTLEPAGLAQAWFAPKPRLAFALGASTRAEVSPNPAFFTLAPRASARLTTARGLAFSLLAEAPVLGSDRTDLVVALFAGWSAPALSPP
ncbi:MAG TPA: hypothetical protein VHJ20_24000 [Polyangia bacterium]|nr:hypothetical protein [Polyangia bacterium]